jgi:hypothetical protein
MKMTKKIFMVAIATAAIALTGCGMVSGKDAFGGKNENGVDNGKAGQAGVKKNLTIHVEAKNDTEFGSKRFQRMWRQLGDKETVQALETVITIDTTKTESNLIIKNDKAVTDPECLFVVNEGDPNATDVATRAVTGLIFDLHCTKDSEDKKLKTYDFVLIGYRPYDNGFYIEKYTGVTADLFEAATNDTSFKKADKFITETESTAYVYAKDHSATENPDAWVKSYSGKLGKDDDGKDYGDKAVSLKQFTVKITQEVKGTYKINIAGEEFEYTPEDESATHPDWYTKENKLTKTEAGYRIGGAGYYVNAPLGTVINANFNSKGEGTIGLEEEVEE